MLGIKCNVGTTCGERSGGLRPTAGSGQWGVKLPHGKQSGVEIFSQKFSYSAKIY
jgi:hypothetical protein